MKPKRCKNPACGETFVPSKSFQSWCCPDCAIAILKHKERKAFKAETRKRKIAMNHNDRKWWLKKAKDACHLYIRMRDAKLPCISCGATKTMQWDAGHYRPAGNNSFLRFDERNIHKQCCQCNDGNKKSGNLTEYRIGLVKKVGVDVVEWLEGPQPLKHWTIDELREVVEHYRQKIKHLKHDSRMV